MTDIVTTAGADAGIAEACVCHFPKRFPPIFR